MGNCSWVLSAGLFLDCSQSWWGFPPPPVELGTFVVRADVFSSFSMRNPESERWKHLGVSWQWKLFRSWKIIESSVFLKMFIEWKSCFSLEDIRDNFLLRSSRWSHPWAWAPFLCCSISLYFSSFPPNAPLPLCHPQGRCRGQRISDPRLSPHGRITASSKCPGDQWDSVVLRCWGETT